MSKIAPYRHQHVPLIFLCCVALFSLIVTPIPVLAQLPSGQAEVEFDGEIIGDESGAFTVTGNVRFIHDTVQIRSDVMYIEPGGEIAHFTGNVDVETEEQTFHGERFVYNLSTETSVLFKPSGSVEVESVNGPVYFRGETMAIESEKVVLSSAMFTTCSCEKPGYYIAGTRMEIIPGYVMIIYNVRFVESGLTLFYWPRLTIPLSESARPPFQLPQIGHNSLDGWYVRTTIPYGPPGSGGGLVHLDWAQFKGYGAGVTHYYRDDDSGNGQIHLYGLANTRTETYDPTVSWTGRLTTKTWDASWEADFEEEGYEGARTQTRSGSLSLQNRRPDGQITLSGSFSNVDSPTRSTDRVSGNFRLSQLLPGNTRLNLTGNTLVDKGTSRERRLLGYRIDISNTSGPITWSVVADERFNPELAKDDPSGAINWNSSGRRPEITIGARPDLPMFGRRFPLTFEVGYGRFGERRAQNSIVNDTRSTAMAQLRTTTIPLGQRLSLGLGGYVRGYWYGTGAERLVLSSTTSLTYRPTNRLTLRTSYEYLDQEGDTPFNFDRTRPHERIRSSAQYRAGSFNATLSGGYNLLNDYPENLTMSLDASPMDKVSLRLQGTYSMRYGYMDSATGTIELGEDESPFSLKLGGRYSFAKQEFDRIDGWLRWKIGTWSLEYGSIYDKEKSELTEAKITVLKDLGCDACRQIGLSYDQTKGEVWFEYRITAIPNLGVRLGSQDDRFMFNLDGWEELIGQDVVEE